MLIMLFTPEDVGVPMSSGVQSLLAWLTADRPKPPDWGTCHGSLAFQFVVHGACLQRTSTSLQAFCRANKAFAVKAVGAPTSSTVESLLAWLKAYRVMPLDCHGSLGFQPE